MGNSLAQRCSPLSRTSGTKPSSQRKWSEKSRDELMKTPEGHLIEKEIDGDELIREKGWIDKMTWGVPEEIERGEMIETTKWLHKVKKIREEWDWIDGITWGGINWGGVKWRNLLPEGEEDQWQMGENWWNDLRGISGRSWWEWNEGIS